MNHGREDIARLLVVTSSLMTFAFVIFLCGGFLSWTIPNVAVTSPVSYFIQAALVSAEVALAFVLWYWQRVRSRVFERDRIAEQARLERVSQDAERRDDAIVGRITQEARVVAAKLAAELLTSAEELIKQQRAQTDAIAKQTAEDFVVTNTKIEEVPGMTADLVEERTRKDEP